MAISVTTAACERGFSSMNLEKTSQRTQMRPDTLDDILRINIDKTTLEQFNPEPAHMLWLDDGPTHIDHHKLRKKLEENQMNSTEAILSLAAEEE